ncbi:MAG: hypothetical protein M3Y53_10905 [Thermoproteota archaeon]|nr:hypothetical protein [Thermoproteota archaeon]
MNIALESTVPIAVGIVIVVVIGYYIFVVGHVPSTTGYPREKVAEPTPYEGPCIDQQSLHDYHMTCSTLNTILQPAK